MRKLLAALLLGSLATAVAAEEMTGAADRLLWCSSAMYWLSVDAYDTGDTKDGDEYDAWATSLTERAALLLESEGRDAAAIEAVREDYDERVVVEMRKPTPKYDVIGCVELASQ